MGEAQDTKLKRLAVMGGTFDPIHYAHLAVAEEAADRVGIEHVLFIPCGQPPHKKAYQISAAEHRYLMTVLATNDNPRFSVSRLELDRPGPSYTIDTLRQLRRDYGPECEIYFITGADAVLEIMTWYQSEAVLEEGRFIAVHRPGYDLDPLDTLLGSARPNVQSLALRELDISSTDLRQRAAQGLSLRYLTPPPVIDYINRHGLYRRPPGAKLVIQG